MNSIRIKLLSTLLALLVINVSQATEGMWVPTMIKQLVADDMQAMGMKVSADDLYRINESSIKDAVVHFNGGCTSVLVSESGLLLTNHHCGYSRIQYHSSLENNYLEDGFWAGSFEEELVNEGMTATIIQEIRDVTEAVLKDVSDEMSEAKRAALVKTNSDALVQKIKDEGTYSAYVRTFYHGNQYLLFVVQEFQDVRLVGAPPSSIGKYGFDTDNWVWPRHTGDFSVFRIYADANNQPAKYSEDNVPYRPKHFLPTSLKGVEKDDFTLVYGFPGRTSNYISSAEVDNVLEVINPLRIKMREASLAVIDKAMAQDPLTKIQYAAKQSRISNAYKKWIGQSKGLKRHKAIAKKDSLESLFMKRISAQPAWQSAYGTLLSEMTDLENDMLPMVVSRNYFIEFFFMGPEVLRFANNFSDLAAISNVDDPSEEAIAEWIAAGQKKLGFFKNYNATVDRDIMLAQIRYFIDGQPEADFLTGIQKSNESLEDFVNRMYTESMFVNEGSVESFLETYKPKHYKKIEADPAYAFAKRIYDYYFENTKPRMTASVNKSDSLMRIWMAAQMEVLPEKTYYPDANGTLRISFGKVEGYEPFDGAEYLHYTTLEGVIAKADPDNPEYHLPERMFELYEKKDYGKYADKDGTMRVCFIASNHTSGGNSGSPVINANGELIGLNFDRTWESTMSDIMFNPTICRNITVDIRYVLFIMDKFAGATHLVDEMQLVE